MSIINSLSEVFARVFNKDNGLGVDVLDKEYVSADEGQLAVDVYQTADDIIIVSPISGVDKEDINISIKDEVITIKGKRQLDIHFKEDEIYTQECYWGSFSRSIILPAEVDQSKVKATFKKGVLVVYVPKSEKVKMRIVKIN